MVQEKLDPALGSLPVAGSADGASAGSTAVAPAEAAVGEGAGTRAASVFEDQMRKSKANQSPRLPGAALTLTLVVPSGIGCQ